MSTSAVLSRPTRARRVSVQAVTAALTAVVREHPKRADRRAVDGLPARYIDRGQPNCLVALVLLRLGFSVGVLRALDQEHPVGELCQAGVKVAESRHPALKKIDPLARALLQFVQDGQDRGERWESIVADALSPTWWATGRRNRDRKPWLFVGP